MQFSWDTILAPGETIQKEFGVSENYRKIILIGSVVTAGIVAFFSIFAGLLLGLCGLFYWWYLLKSKHYAFTNKRIVLVDSFVGTSSTSIDYAQITDIEIEQSFFDEKGGWGTLIINTAGTHVPEVRLSFIDSPLQIKQTLDTIRDSKNAS